MKNILGRLRLQTMIVLAFAISFAIFLGVIALNFLAIGQVRDMNQQLRAGPLENRHFWQKMVTQLDRAEKLRRQFQIDRKTESIESMHANLSKTHIDLEGHANLKADEWAIVTKKNLTVYGQEFQHLVDTDIALRKTRVQLVENRDGLETAIYDAENAGLEEALRDFLLAELDFFATPTAKDKVKTLVVLLDRILRDAAQVTGNALPDAVEVYRKTFKTLLEHHANEVVRALSLEQQAQAILAKFGEALDRANQMARAASQAADTKANKALTTALIWTFVGVVLAIVLAVFLIRAITRPIRLLSSTLVDMEKSGDFSKRVDYTHQNEIGQAVAAMNSLFDSLQGALGQINEAMQAAAMGNFEKRVTLELAGDLGQLKNNINGSMDSLNTAINAIVDVTSVMAKGDFQCQIDVNLQGSLDVLKNNTNHMIHSLKGALGQINGVMQAAAMGNFEQRVTLELAGDLDTLKNNINHSMDSLNIAINAIVEDAFN